MADLGTDFAGFSDITPTLATVSGRRGLIESIARRFITPPGALWYDPDYGFDLRVFLSGTVTASAGQIASGVIAEAEKDERVEQASCDVKFIGTTLFVKVGIADANGPFEFVLQVSKVTVEILKG